MKIGAVMFFTTDSMRPAPLAKALEERGFESLWVPEHTHIPSSRRTAYPAGGGLIRPYYDIMDPFLVLNAAATVTTKLKIGTGIALIVQRDPIVTAKEVSTIDQLSQGRFLFGVGNGWNQDEIENHGTAFKSRHKLARERIEAMKTIWANEEPEYHGERGHRVDRQVPQDGGRRRPRSGEPADQHLPHPRQPRPAEALPGHRHRPCRLLPAGRERGQDQAHPRPLGLVAASVERLREWRQGAACNNCDSSKPYSKRAGYQWDRNRALVFA